MYRQHYNPTGSVFLSAVVAAIPILVLLYFIAVHPHRDKRGGFMYPFFAAYLGWLSVFLTGSDTASNAPFGSLQRITAR